MAVQPQNVKFWSRKNPATIFRQAENLGPSDGTEKNLWAKPLWARPSNRFGPIGFEIKLAAPSERDDANFERLMALHNRSSDKRKAWLNERHQLLDQVQQVRLFRFIHWC